MAEQSFKYIINTQLKLDGGSLSSLVSKLKEEDARIREIIDGINKNKVKIEVDDKNLESLKTKLNALKNESITIKFNEPTGLANIKSQVDGLKASLDALTRQEHIINIRTNNLGGHLQGEVDNFNGNLKISSVTLDSHALDEIKRQIENQKYILNAEIIPDKKIKASEVFEWDMGTRQSNTHGQVGQGAQPVGFGSGQGVPSADIRRYVQDEIKTMETGFNNKGGSIGGLKGNERQQILDAITSMISQMKNAIPKDGDRVGQGLNSGSNVSYRDTVRHTLQNAPYPKQMQMVDATIMQKWSIAITRAVQALDRIDGVSNISAKGKSANALVKNVETLSPMLDEARKKLEQITSSSSDYSRVHESYSTALKNVANGNLDTRVRVYNNDGTYKNPKSSDIVNTYKPLVEEVGQLKDAVVQFKDLIRQSVTTYSLKVPNSYQQKIPSYQESQKIIAESKKISQDGTKSLNQRGQGYGSALEYIRKQGEQGVKARGTGYNQALTMMVNSQGRTIKLRGSGYNQALTMMNRDKSQGIRQRGQGYNQALEMIRREEAQQQAQQEKVDKAHYQAQNEDQVRNGYRRVGTHGYYYDPNNVLLNPNTTTQVKMGNLQDQIKSYSGLAKEMAGLDENFKGFSKTFRIVDTDENGNLRTVNSLTYAFDQFGQSSQRGAKSFKDMISMMAEKTFIYGALGTAFYQIAFQIGEAVKNMSEFQQQMIRFQTFTQGNSVYSQFTPNSVQSDTFNMASQYGVSATMGVMPVYQDIIRRQDLIGTTSGNGNLPVSPNGNNIVASRQIANNLAEKVLQMGIVGYGPSLNNQDLNKTAEDMISVYSNTYNGNNPTTGKQYTPNEKKQSFNGLMDYVANLEKGGADSTKIMDVIGELAPEATSMGINVKTLAGLAGGYSLKDSGAQADEMTNVIKTFTNALEKPDSPSTSRALTLMGVHPYTDGKGGTPLDPQGIIDEIIKKFPSLSESAKSQVALYLSSQSGRGKAMQAPLLNFMESLDIPTVRNQFLNPNSLTYNQTGSAKQMAQMRMDSLHGQWTKLTQNMDRLTMSIGNAGVLGALTNLLKGLNSLVGVVNGAVTAFNSVGETVSKATGGYFNPSQVMGAVGTGMAVYGMGKFGWNILGKDKQKFFKGAFGSIGKTNPNDQLASLRDEIGIDAISSIPTTNRAESSISRATRQYGESIGAIESTSKISPQDARKLAQAEGLANRYNRMAGSSIVRNTHSVSSRVLGGIGNVLGSVNGFLLGSGGLSGRKSNASAVGSVVRDATESGVKKFGSSLLELGAKVGPLLLVFGELTVAVGLVVGVIELFKWALEKKKNDEAKVDAKQIGNYYNDASNRSGNAVSKFNNDIKDFATLTNKQRNGKKLSTSEQKRLSSLRSSLGNKYGIKEDNTSTVVDMGDGMYSSIPNGTNQFRYVLDGHHVTGNAKSMIKAMTQGGFTSVGSSENNFQKVWDKIGPTDGGYNAFDLNATNVNESMKNLTDLQDAYQTKSLANQVGYFNSQGMAGNLQANISNDQNFLGNAQSTTADLQSRKAWSDKYNIQLQNELQNTQSKLNSKYGKSTIHGNTIKGVTNAFYQSMATNGNIDDLTTTYRDNKDVSGYLVELQSAYNMRNSTQQVDSQLQQWNQAIVQNTLDLKKNQQQLALTKTGIYQYQQAISQLGNSVAMGQAIQSSATTVQGQVYGGQMALNGMGGQLSQYQSMASSLQSSMSNLKSSNPSQDFSLSALYGTDVNKLSDAQSSYKQMLDAFNQAEQGIASSTQAIAQQKQQMLALIVDTDQYRGMWSRVQNTIQTVHSAQIALGNVQYQNTATRQANSLQQLLGGKAFDVGGNLHNQYQQQSQQFVSQYQALAQAQASYGSDKSQLQQAVDKINGDFTDSFNRGVTQPLQDLVNNGFTNATNTLKTGATTIQNAGAVITQAVNAFSADVNNFIQNGGAGGNTTPDNIFGTNSGGKISSKVSKMSDGQVLNAYMKSMGYKSGTKEYTYALKQMQLQYNGNSSSMYDYMRKAISPPSNNISISGKNNEDKVYSYLKGQGLSNSAIAGIIGNLQVESYSSIDPTATNGIGAHGIAQWLGGRKSGLYKYADQQGMSADSLGTQLQYMMQEMQSGKWIDINKLNSMTPSQAATYIEKKYEVAGTPSQSALSKRVSNANNAYRKYTGKNAPSGSDASSLNPVGQLTQAYTDIPQLMAQDKRDAINANTNSLVNTDIEFNKNQQVRANSYQAKYDPYGAVSNNLSAYQTVYSNLAQQQYSVQSSLSSYKSQASSLKKTMRGESKSSESYKNNKMVLDALNSGITELTKQVTSLSKAMASALGVINASPVYNSSTANHMLIDENNTIGKLGAKGGGSVAYLQNVQAVNQESQNFMTTAKKTQIMGDYWNTYGQQTGYYDHVRTANDQNKTNILFSQINGLNEIFGKLTEGTQHYYSTLSDLANVEQQLHDAEQKRLTDSQTEFNLTGKGLGAYTQQMAYTQSHDLNQSRSNLSQSISQYKSGKISGVGSSMDDYQGLANLQVISSQHDAITQQMDSYKQAVVGAFQAGAMSVDQYIKKLNDLRNTQDEAKQSATQMVANLQGDFQSNFADALTKGMEGAMNSPQAFMQSMKQSFATEISGAMSGALVQNTGLSGVMNGIISQITSVVASGNPNDVANMFNNTDFGKEFTDALAPFIPMINQIVASTKGILTTLTDQTFNTPNGFKIDDYLYNSIKGKGSIGSGATETPTNSNTNSSGSPMGDGSGSGSTTVQTSGNGGGNSSGTGSTSGSGSTSTGGAEGTSSGSKPSPKPAPKPSPKPAPKPSHKPAPKPSHKPITNHPTTSSTGSSYSSYTVEKGDTLSGIGSKLHVDWHSIASLNGIKSPYTIRVGEKLKVPKGSSSSSSSHKTSSSHSNPTKHIKSDVNFRSSAGYGNNIIEVLKKGASVDYLGTDKGWAHIKYGSKSGYVGPDYIYHTGGIAGVMNFASTSGLKPNEISAVLQKGEPIFQPKQLSDLIGGAYGMGANSSNTTNNHNISINISAGSNYDQAGIEGVVKEAVGQAMNAINKQKRRNNLNWNGTSF